MSNDENPTIVASARFYASKDRVEKLVEDMLEWSRENSANLAVARTGVEEVSVSTTYDPEDCSNGTFSAAAWLGTAVERALSEVSEYRWFGGAVIKASVRTARDEKPPQEGDERVEDGVTLRYSADDEEWIAQGETRVDDVGNGMVKIRQFERPEGTRVEVCDMLGGHRGEVSLEEWESWDNAHDEEPDVPPPSPRAFTDQVAADEAEYERTRPERAEEF